MDSYPILLIPNGIINSWKEQVPQPPAPVEPVKPKLVEPSILWVIVSSIIGAILIIAILSEDDESPVIWIGAIPLIVYYFSYARVKRNRSIEFQKNMATHISLSEIHTAALKEYEMVVEELNSQKHVHDYRTKRVLESLKNTYNPSRLSREVKKGRYEESFFSVLDDFFPGKVFMDLQVGDFEVPYVPDIAYVDRETSLHIDIEIDEPYIEASKQPIHYDDIDNNRNSFFLQRNWVVVRFAEEQIAEEPITCARFIQKVLNHILVNEDLNSDLKKIARWTHAEALSMGRKNFRDKYNVSQYSIQ